MDSKIEIYELQLQTVEKALESATEEKERVSLLSLREDLQELIKLTKQTIDIAENTKNDEDEHEDVLDNEMKQFMNEIQLLSGSENILDKDKTEVRAENLEDNNLMELKNQLESMVGQKCSAPHQHSWGSVSYHNAIICGIGETVELSDNGLSDVHMRVLFTNPTHREMLPCTYFLEGECKFDAENCHFSHGELVPFQDLKEYTEPEFEKLSRNCVVLAKMSDRIWHRGRVICANFVEKTCRVRLDMNQHKEKEMDFQFENLLPITNDEEISSCSSSDENSDSEDDMEDIRRAQLVQQSLFTFPSDQPLGEWEKYTRGIGSKLMEKMGYIHGTGLGWDGKGIVTPIAAQVLPQGCSLDHCMELREAANGCKNFFNVEKKLNRDKKKQEALNAKAYERESQRTDVFSFLNGSILNTKKQQDYSTCSSKVDTSSLHKQSTKSLNVESVRIADDIRKIERDIAKIRESMRRNANSSNTLKRLQAQLNTRTQEMETLKKLESSLSKEQATRKTKDKLFVF